jgi:thymidine phosphorylase
MNVRQTGELKVRRLGIDTHAEAMVFLRKDSAVCRSEGFTSHNRILLSTGRRHAIATLYQVEGGILAPDEVGLSDVTCRLLEVRDGEVLTVRHAPPVESLSLMRRRIYGHDLDPDAMHRIIADIVDGRYSAIEISAFIAACATRPLAHSEICGLTRAMVETGNRLRWDAPVIADKHSVGGVPGNRTTPIVVAICSELGLVMPKTSSRAITSPAGTADTMETLAPVALNERKIRATVLREGGCIAWGGALDISPADDILIRIEHALDLDSEGQMIASILSKKIAAGATHLVIDMPVGATAKVRTPAAAAALSQGLMAVAREFGINVQILMSDGAQPVGRGIGPALEAHDVLAVLRNEPGAPKDLRDHALVIAAALLEMTAKAPAGKGLGMAADVLDSGRAWRKFQRICEAQGGLRTPPVAVYRRQLTAPADGIVTAMDNRRIARLAKLAGAPEDKAAGVEMHVRIGEAITRGTPFCTVHAESVGELEYAFAYALANQDMFSLVPP